MHNNGKQQLSAVTNIVLSEEGKHQKILPRGGWVHCFLAFTKAVAFCIILVIQKRLRPFSPTFTILYSQITPKDRPSDRSCCSSAADVFQKSNERSAIHTITPQERYLSWLTDAIDTADAKECDKHEDAVNKIGIAVMQMENVHEPTRMDKWRA